MTALDVAPGEVGRARAEIAPSPPDIEDMVYSWLAGHHTARTRKEYGRDLSDWFRFCHTHNLDPLTVDRAALDAWVTQQLANGSAAASVKRRLVAVRGWYEHLVEDLEIITRNPASRVRAPKVHQTIRVPVVTVDQAARMAEPAAAQGPDLALG